MFLNKSKRNSFYVLLKIDIPVRLSPVNSFVHFENFDICVESTISKHIYKIISLVRCFTLGCSEQLSQNRFLDPSTPSMRKGRDSEKTVKIQGKTWGGGGV